MKKASITETKNKLSSLIDVVKHGETVLIMDRDRPVARLEPIVRSEDDSEETRLARLERAGIIRRGNPEAVKDILSTPPPKLPLGASVLEALLDERRHGR